MSKTNDPPLLRRLLARWWYIWGVSLCYQGNRAHERSFYEGGIRSFRRATQLWPGFARAYYRSGLIRGRELGEYSAALVDLGRAIHLAPEWADPYLQRGLFHRFHGDYAAARADLQRYLELAEAGYWRDEAARQLELVHAELRSLAG